MKILLTGGCGYVGTSLTPSLLEAGHEVIVYDTQWFGNYLQPHPKLTIVQGDIRDIELPEQVSGTVVRVESLVGSS